MAASVATGLHAEVKLVGNLAESRDRLLNNEHVQSFAVIKHDDYLMLIFSDNHIFAQVQVFEVKAFSQIGKIQSLFDQSHTPGQAKLRVDINIYGSAADADAVGLYLGSTSKLYLQDPEYGTENIEYLNRQLIHFPGFEEPKVFAGPGADFANKTSKALQGLPQQQSRLHYIQYGGG
ncbi:hypothetical protein QC762_0104190 [Podospora pseudocomata]|uniref:Uncharacterized protein n=1 Tax=Podospora pseudocomata TaxID=2093779 RepID=A0ABR0G2J7_9PEZI|nr:hypothetical protein QC762_0104190 [Podospora pseudocomata]